MLAREAKEETLCKHCGETCTDRPKSEFCCYGCEQVYLLLHENGLSQYYSIEQHPGLSLDTRQEKHYDYLKDLETINKLILFQDEHQSRISFKLPAIHCSSCLWLLENLPRLNKNIISCKVNFLEKKAIIAYDHNKMSLHEVVLLLSKIGYEPELNFALLSPKKKSKIDRSLMLKIGVAGFSFGNIMLLSFPEYLGFDNAARLFFLGYLNLALALPVLLYAGFDYLKTAWEDIVRGHLGIHVPLAIGMVTLFGRSAYEIISGVGEGYLDSFAGFVLFLLIGKWFQNFTEKSIAFDRDYKSYFPIAVPVLHEGKWISKPINKLESQDIVQIKNGEIIPCDGELISGNAQIDYSFVTGESVPQPLNIGQKIYAGGRQTSTLIEVRVEKQVDQGYLTQLWQESPFKESKSSNAEVLLNKISKYFTIVILAIALVTFAIWFFIDKSIAFQSVTAVLIVACPCALALSIPFILGNATRILSKIKFYTKSAGTLENLLDIDSIVFDKTGTITENDSMRAEFIGNPVLGPNTDIVYTICSQSSHPLSKAIAKSYPGKILGISNYHELTGKGISALVNGKVIRLGSEAFIFGTAKSRNRNVIAEIEGSVIGHFQFTKELRSNMVSVISSLDSYHLHMLSGDNASEESRMQRLFPKEAALMFNQSPKDKLKYIQELQERGHKVMMIGDGLNDAGALKQSDVGLVVAENNNTFTPACDAIISSDTLPGFVKILTYVKSLKFALYGAFLIAFLYNFIGLCFAVTGNLSPIVAAILMPTSSITIMIYGLLSSKWLSIKLKRLI